MTDGALSRRGTVDDACGLWVGFADSCTRLSRRDRRRVSLRGFLWTLCTGFFEAACDCPFHHPFERIQGVIGGTRCLPDRRADQAASSFNISDSTWVRKSAAAVKQRKPAAFAAASTSAGSFNRMATGPVRPG